MNKRLKSSTILLILLGAALIAVGFLAESSRAESIAASTKDGKYIDVHCHLACYPRPGSDCFVSDALKNNFRYKLYLHYLGVNEKELREQGDGIVAERLSAEIARSQTVGAAVVLALDGAVTGGKLDLSKTEVYVPNEFVAGETVRHKNLLFGASINPNRTDALDRLKWAHEHGAVLVKWIPSVMLIDPADERFVPFYQKMIEYHLPLLVHSGEERTFTHAQDDLSDPARLELPLKLGVTVIAAHLASTGETDGQKNFERLLPLFAKYPNLYGDISATTSFNRIGFLQKALHTKVLRGRMLYGTDWPLEYFPFVSPWYHLEVISPVAAARVSAIENTWDRDVALKKAMGVPEEVFTNVAKIIRR